MGLFYLRVSRAATLAAIVAILSAQGIDSCLASSEQVTQESQTLHRSRKLVSRRVLATTVKGQFLPEHNKARKTIPVPNLSWDAKIAQAAQKWAKTLATTKGCKIEHSTSSQRGGRGENLYMEWGSQAPKTSGIGARSVANWMAEKSDYIYATNTCKPQKMCGHYTQVIWSTSKKLGCGYASCTTSDGNKALISVCQYNPPGNIIGQKPY